MVPKLSVLIGLHTGRFFLPVHCRRHFSLIERKRYLRDSFGDTGVLVFVNGIVGAGDQVFELVRSYGFEGMLCKRLASTYQKGRSRDWLKIKHAGYER
jgi:bifunctional non-homologous end joining protein LigD